MMRSWANTASAYWAVVQQFYDQGHSVRDCIRAFGFSSASWHQAVKRGLVTPRPAFRPAAEVFQANTHRHRGRLKDRLLRMGIKTNTCDRCGLTEWRDQPITMALHHVNGDRLDNRIENLELWSRWQPSGQRVRDKVEFALDILNRYLPEALAGQVPLIAETVVPPSGFEPPLPP